MPAALPAEEERHEGDQRIWAESDASVTDGGHRLLIVDAAALCNEKDGKVA